MDRSRRLQAAAVVTLHATPGPVRQFAVPRIEAPPESQGFASQLATRLAQATEDGYADGLAAGRAAGLAAAQHEVEAAIAAHAAATRRLEAAAAGLEAAAGDLYSRDQLAIVEIERSVVELAVELAVATIGESLAGGAEGVHAMLNRVVALMPDRGAAVVRVHPDLVDPIAELLAGPLADARWRDAQVVADPAVVDGCVVEVGPCRIDAQIATAIERLRVAFG